MGAPLIVMMGNSGDALPRSLSSNGTNCLLLFPLHQLSASYESFFYTRTRPDCFSFISSLQPDSLLTPLQWRCCYAHKYNTLQISPNQMCATATYCDEGDAGITVVDLMQLCKGTTCDYAEGLLVLKAIDESGANTQILKMIHQKESKCIIQIVFL